MGESFLISFLKEHKDQIDKILDQVNLPDGYFSQVYTIEDKTKSIHFRIGNDNGKLFLIFQNEKNRKYHIPFIKEDRIYLYDPKLYSTVSIKLETYIKNSLLEKKNLKELKDQIDIELNKNLSTEQKFSLSMGHDVTLDVSYSLKKTKQIVYKGQINLVADYTLFFGKNTLIPQENKIEMQQKKNYLTEY